jgi:TonB family protein
MGRGFWLIPVLALGPLTWAADDQVPAPTEKSSLVGYVDCSRRDKDKLTLTFLDACGKVPSVRLACGQSLAVFEKQGPWLKVGLPEGGFRYILARLVSQKADAFLPFDVDSGILNLGPASCGPRAIYSPGPEYSDKARKKKINGTVVLSLKVGTDGLAHDIQVEKKLGYGLDEKAVEAIRKWKFQPELRDGQPVETHINVEMTFRLY